MFSDCNLLGRSGLRILRLTRRITAAFALISMLFCSPGVAIAQSTDAALRASHIQVVRSFFELMHRKEIDAWSRLWAADGRIVVPYPPAGFATSIEGRDAILTAFRALFGNFESFDAEITAIYPTSDSDAICVEYTVRAVVRGGTQYTNRNIAVFRFSGEKISAYHDYFDPRRFQAVIDALPK